MQQDQQLSPHEKRRIAVAAVVDPRTVDRVFSGENVTSNTRERVKRALLELGLDELLAALRLKSSPASPL